MQSQILPYILVIINENSDFKNVLLTNHKLPFINVGRFYASFNMAGYFSSWYISLGTQVKY
jgi:hypothetical protein